VLGTDFISKKPSNKVLALKNFMENERDRAINRAKDRKELQRRKREAEDSASEAEDSA
jgi:hypothetical protein